MLLIDSLHKVYYCPLKENRLVDDSAGKAPYRRVDTLAWSEAELVKGKSIKIKGFPSSYKLKLFRVAVSTHRTDWVVTNDLAQDSSDATQAALKQASRSHIIRLLFFSDVAPAHHPILLPLQSACP